MNIYIAAPYAEKARAEELAGHLEGHAGIIVVSTWHRQPGAEDMSEQAQIDGLDMNLDDMSKADACVALCHRGTPRATFSEIGMLLGAGRPVVWTHGPAREGLNIFSVHPLVTCVPVGWESTTTLASMVRRALSALVAAIDAETEALDVFHSMSGLRHRATAAAMGDALHDTLPPGPGDIADRARRGGL